MFMRNRSKHQEWVWPWENKEIITQSQRHADAVSDLMNTPQNIWLQKKLETWKINYELTWDYCVFQLNNNTNSTYIPVAFSDGKNTNEYIAAIQEFDPRAPNNSKVINNTRKIINQAIEEKIIQHDPQDENYVALCLFIVNELLLEQFPPQNNAANEEVVNDAIQNNEWIVTQQTVDTKKAHVCKDFAVLLSYVMWDLGIRSYCAGSKNEEHMYCLIDTPNEWVIRVDAKKHPEYVVDNTFLDTYYEYNTQSYTL